MGVSSAVETTIPEGTKREINGFAVVPLGINNPTGGPEANQDSFDLVYDTWSTDEHEAGAVGGSFAFVVVLLQSLVFGGPKLVSKDIARRWRNCDGRNGSSPAERNRPRSAEALRGAHDHARPQSHHGWCCRRGGGGSLLCRATGGRRRLEYFAPKGGLTVSAPRGETGGRWIRIGIVAHSFLAAENRSRGISSCRREASLRNNFHARSTST
jgi:hypothetical protein